MSEPTKKDTSKKNPIPVRFDATEDTALDEIAAQTGLTKSEVIRRACRLALPKFLSREIDLFGITPLIAAVKPPAHNG